MEKPTIVYKYKIYPSDEKLLKEIKRVNNDGLGESIKKAIFEYHDKIVNVSITVDETDPNDNPPEDLPVVDDNDFEPAEEIIECLNDDGDILIKKHLHAEHAPPRTPQMNDGGYPIHTPPPSNHNQLRPLVEHRVEPTYCTNTKVASRMTRKHNHKLEQKEFAQSHAGVDDVHSSLYLPQTPPSHHAPKAAEGSRTDTRAYYPHPSQQQVSADPMSRYANPPLRRYDDQPPRKPSFLEVLFGKRNTR